MKKMIKMKNSTWIQLAVVALLIVVVIFFGTVYEGGAGEAIFIGDLPPLGPVDLVKEQSVTFQSLPTGGRTIIINTPIDPYSLTPVSYTFNIDKRDANTYNFEINQTVTDPALPRPLVMQDVLDVGGDSALVYLTTTDAVADLLVELNGTTVTVTNRHYLSSGGFEVSLQDNNTGEILGNIIRVNSSMEWRAIANLTTKTIRVRPNIIISVTPLIFNDSITLTSWAAEPVTNPDSTVNISWGTPAGKVAGLLDVSYRVQDLTTHKYYRLAVGNLTYHLELANHPLINVTYTNPNNNDAQMKVVFQPTRNLQPFSSPCTLNPGSLATLLANNNVDRVYSFNALTQSTQIANAGPAPDDFDEFEPFKGYFVKLLREESVSLTFNCKVESLQPAVRGLPPALQGLEQPQPDFVRGWNLFSLPGMIPQSLNDYVVRTNFNLFECSQAESCPELRGNQFLVPGKVYWVYFDQNYRGSSVLR
jgi:hypothetical protein